MDDVGNLHESEKTRRNYGIHLTSTEIFHNYIFPEIRNDLDEYLWVDLFAGEGNLILPLLNSTPKDKRIEFFKKHIYLFDVQPDLIKKCIENAIHHGIPFDIAKKNIKIRNNLDTYPKNLRNKQIPIYHITNPPYLYLGYIRKHDETQPYLKYFENENNGYQDLYQIAMMNDLRNGVENLIYIIPSNFLFGATVSNKFRIDFLKYYRIIKMIIIETKVFEHTGTNICVGFFKRKDTPKHECITFNGLKIKNDNDFFHKQYSLKPKFKYRAGSEFMEFLENYKTQKPLRVKYYLLRDEVDENRGNNQIHVIDSNLYKNNEYKKRIIEVNDHLKQKIESNILYVQTVDKGSSEGKVGLRIIQEDFGVEGVYVSENTYRTHPIQIFLEPKISIKDQELLKDYFNFILEHFRKELDSEFLTTYKYSKAKYTRKYLGLTQVRKLIETFPIINFDDLKETRLIKAVEQKDFRKLLSVLKKKNE